MAIITVQCPFCEVEGRVSDEYLGRKVKCRSCGTLYPVEDATAGAPLEEDNEFIRSIRKMDQPIKRKRVIDDDEYPEIPRRKTANPDLTDGEFIQTPQKNNVPPIWWVAGGVGGTLVIAGCVALGLLLFRKADISQPTHVANLKPASSEEELRLREAERRLQEAEERAKEAQRKAQEETDRLARLEAERIRQEEEREAKLRKNKKTTPERFDIDPAVQGVWKLHATSGDEGKTVKKYEGVVFARVTGTKVRTIFGEDTTLTVDRVAIVKINGNPANLVKFTNGTLWLLTKKPGEASIVVAIVQYDGKQLKETYRFLVTAEN